MIQNRRYPRKECLAKIRLSWQSEGRGLKEWGMIQDRSTGGLGIRFPFPIDVGSVIAIAQGFSTSFGVVRHCTKINGQFFLGVEYCDLEEGTTPAPSWVAAAKVVSAAEEEKAPAAAATPPAPAPAPVHPRLRPTGPEKPEEEILTNKVPLKPTGLRSDFAMLHPPPRK